MFKTIAQFIAPANMPSPLLWGDETIVRERLGAGVSELNLSRRVYRFNYPFPPSEVVDLFRLHYGPANLAFASLDPAGRLFTRSWNRCGLPTTVRKEASRSWKLSIST
jgi:hypothetical protein